MCTRRIAVFVAAALCAVASASAYAQDASAEGERQFKARCASCHSTEPGQNRNGPHLSDLLGRKAGTVEGARYSAAMKASCIVWDDRSLDAYLANPRETVPGTTMPVGVPTSNQRAQVIEYLRTLSAGAAKG